MERILIDKLRAYLAENAPEIILELSKDLSVTSYLEDKVYQVMPLAAQLAREGKPQYVIGELCLNELTKDLRPSKFLYIRDVLEEEFLQTYKQFREMGVLTFETVNLIQACKPVFEALGFTEENEDDRGLRYAVIGTIEEYLHPLTDN